MQTDNEQKLNDEPSPLSEPAWRIALFFPEQGAWSEDEYLNLSGGPLVEFDNGRIEVQDMPTKAHQRMAQFIYRLLFSFLAGKDLGEAFIAPLPTRLWPGKFREPDVLFLRSGRAEYQGQYPDGADLVVEIVSKGAENRRRDLEDKRADYAKAGISEYWILDPEEEAATVLRLAGGVYHTHGVFKPGQNATSVELPGFEVSVSDWFDSAKGN
ncbi:MAG: Uma2 family endonuclease [Planctomycetota bacterium]